MHSEKEKSFLQGVYKAAGLGQGDPKGWSAFRPQCRDWSLGPHTNTIISLGAEETFSGNFALKAQEIDLCFFLPKLVRARF